MCVDSVLSSDLPRIILSRQHVDDRGWFSETFHEQRLRDLGISCRFVQDNQSVSKRAGTLRDLHFQVPSAAQAKLAARICNGRRALQPGDQIWYDRIRALSATAHP
jgi:dTDP-4-dehydrorhamnose 3,5-epimerase-like enzyme